MLGVILKKKPDEKPWNQRLRTSLHCALIALTAVGISCLYGFLDDGVATVLVVGAPVRRGDRLYNCALAIADGRLLGVVPKSYLPNYREFEALYAGAIPVVDVDPGAGRKDFWATIPHAPVTYPKHFRKWTRVCESNERRCFAPNRAAGAEPAGQPSAVPHPGDTRRAARRGGLQHQPAVQARAGRQPLL